MDLDKQLEEAQNAESEEKDTNADKPSEDDSEKAIEEKPANETEQVDEESQENVYMGYNSCILIKTLLHCKWKPYVNIDVHMYV